MCIFSGGSILRGLAIGLMAFVLPVTAHGQPARSLRQDVYGDPLPAGAVLRLGTKRLQTKGGFGWMPDGKALATYRDGTIFVWDMEDGHCRESLFAPINVDPFYTYGTAFVVSGDGQRILCAGRDGSLATWNLETSDLASLPAAIPPVTTDNRAVALHPAGKEFVTLRASGELEFRYFCELPRAAGDEAGANELARRHAGGAFAGWQDAGPRRHAGVRDLSD
jgi:hypothetical protein